MSKDTLEVILREMDPVEDIAEVFTLLGILNQEQAELWWANGIGLYPPQAGLGEYSIDLIVVAQHDGFKVAGLIATEPCNTFPDTTTIADIVLYPEYRGKGIGTQAMRLALAAIKQTDAKHVNLNVHVDNKAAIALYEKLGFVAANTFMTKELK